MATFDNTYSRWVAWLKVVLPLIALGILSTLFLFARTLNPERAIPYADVDIDELVREQGVTGPTISAVTRDGTAIIISAATVRPDLDTPQRMEAREIEARLDFPNGGVADITAPEGDIRGDEDVAHLGGGVLMLMSDGYQIRTPQLRTALAETDVETLGPVEAIGPPGDLVAGKARVTQSEKGGYVLVFNEGVRLVYQPGRVTE